ncbi:hypothetical protein DRJ22_00945 [Candidatus Woesearchaeota archaeon]|nr:MAG: hypothetical protein DRJ22_00945 [Candidatus Woesearchaeota archaeon]
MKKTGVFLILVLLTILTANSAISDIVLSNSANWEDAYSTAQYGALQGHTPKYLMSQKHTDLILNELPKDQKILVVESPKTPYARRYANRLKNLGYKAETMLGPEEGSLNLDLAKRLRNIKNFIIVDPTYGYSAISVIPYAQATNSYVLFATKDTINEVTKFLDFRKPDKLLIYGDLDEKVLEELKKYSPEIIHKGNKFKDNLEIVDRYLQIAGIKQPILTSGEFLEEEILLAGKNQEPIIFVGKHITPKYVLDYIKKQNFRVTVLIGNELISAAEAVRDETNTRVFIKYAKGHAGGGGEFYKPVRGLDVFRLPSTKLNLILESISYNTKTQQVELLLQNTEKLKTYLTTSIGIIVDGKQVLTLGDEKPQTIGGNEAKGFVYKAPELMNYFAEKKNITADIYIPYGITDDSFEYQILTKKPLVTTQELGGCKLEIKDATYIKNIQRFKIRVKGTQGCYARARIQDLIVNDEKTTPESETKQLESKTTEIYIKQRMTDVDLADNPKILVKVRYGKRKQILSQLAQKELKLKVISKEGLTTMILLGMGAVIILLLLLLLLLLWKKKRK